VEKASFNPANVEFSVPASARPAGRIEWIDDVKGMAIVLVVYGHVMQGAASAGSIPAGFQDFSNAFVYSFHMPAFFFVSGLLSARALTRSMAKYVRDRAATIAWPYLVWTVVNLIVFSVFGRFYHHAIVNPRHALLVCLWDPGEFWFLHTLFCIQLLMVLTLWIRIETMGVLSLIGFFFAGALGFSAGDKVLFFLPFFVAGVVCGPFTGRAAKWTGWPGYGAAAILFVVQAVVIGCFPTLSRIGELALGFTGTLGLIGLALGANQTLFSAICSRAGAASLGIFLMHPYFQGLSRVVLERFFGVGGGFSVAIQVIVAVVVSIYLYEHMTASRLRWLFTLKPEQKLAAT
jgi:fucose 4-O-acetylase-like acetyltransferase